MDDDGGLAHAAQAVCSKRDLKEARFDSANPVFDEREESVCFGCRRRENRWDLQFIGAMLLADTAVVASKNEPTGAPAPVRLAAVLCIDCLANDCDIIIACPH